MIHPSLKLLQMAKDKLRKEFIEYWYGDDWKDYLDDSDIYWSGHVLCISDIFVSIDDIVTIFEHKIPLDIFHDWYWHSVENEQDHRRINLKTYAKFREKATHEQIMEDMDKENERRQTPEYKAQCEKDMKELYDKGMKELKKFIK